MTWVLGVIPARSGSKGVPEKNIRDLGGKPLMAHQIENSISADSIDRTIVSTDSEQFAKIARDFGADVPFVRPAELATDEVPVISVYKHALEHFEESGNSPRYIVGLQPTSPFTKPTEIDSAVGLIKKEDFESVVSVAEIEAEQHPSRAYQRRGDRILPYSDMTVDEPVQRQQLSTAYCLTGAIIVRHRSILSNWGGEDFALGSEVGSIIQTGEQRIDIDTDFEYRLAKALYRYHREGRD